MCAERRFHTGAWRLCVAWFAVAAAACAPEVGTHLAPRPASIEPALQQNDRDVPVIIRGDDFFVRATQRLEGDSVVEVDSAYEARLGDVALRDVRWIDTHTLSAVVPGGIPAGVWDLTVTNAAGTSGVLSEAYEAVALLPPDLHGSIAVAPEEVKLGETTVVTLTIENRGESDALNVAPSNPELSGTCTLMRLARPSNRDIPAGEARTFTWQYAGIGVGDCHVSIDAAAIDATRDEQVLMPRVTSSEVRVRTPPLLEPSIEISPARVSVGGTVQLTLTVRNTGRVDVVGLTPQVQFEPSGVFTPLTQPAPRTVATTATVEFTWTFEATQAGVAAATVTATGTDPTRSLPVTLPPLQTSPISVERAAELVVTTTLPSRVSLGQNFTLAVSVHNAGEAAALGVSVQPPQASGTGAATVVSMPPAAQDIPGGATVMFPVELEAVSSGELVFSAQAGGTDFNDGRQVMGADSSDVLVLEPPAELVITSFSAPAQITRAQSFPVTLTVQNVGSATALNVLPVPNPPAESVTGGAVLVTQSMPPAVTLAGGASATLTWQYTEQGTASGYFALSTQMGGTDANSGAVIASNIGATSTTVVQSPPQLSVSSFTVPPSVARGTSFTAQLVVVNTGDATAQNVVPVPAPPTVAATGGVSASTASAAPAQNIPGGGSATWSWSYVDADTGSGTLALATTLTGTDVNTGQTVSSAPASSNTATVQKAAALTAVSFSIPSAVTQGQTFTAALMVRNDGEATALNVLPVPLPPTLTTSGTASASTSTVISPVNIAGGATHTFSWTYVASGSGTLQLSAAASGTDAITGAATSTSALTTGTASVMPPSALQVTSISVPAAVNRGQTFTVAMTVTNSGGTTAINVTPNPSPPSVTATGGASATTATTITPATLPPGASTTFTWSFTENGASAGTLQFTAGVTAVDQVSMQPVTGNSATSAVVQVQRPAALSVQSFSAPTKVSRGQTFSSTLVVKNTGDATANLSAPATPVVQKTGGANASTSSPQQAVTIPGGATASFTWSWQENGSGPGTLSLSVTLAGTDANTGAALSASASSGAVVVESPAALVITGFTIPGAVSRGQPFTAKIDVQNSGQATAVAVVASPSPPSVTATGGAAATTNSSVAPLTIPGGGTASLQWTFVENGSGPGSLSLTTQLSAKDQNSNATITSPPANSNLATVQTPAALSITSFTLPASLSRGQAFTAQMVVTNTGQATAQQVTPVPTPPTTVSTGGAAATSSSTVTPVTLAGGASATFSWSFVENGTSPGTLALTGGVSGQDANSQAMVSATGATTNTATVQTPGSLMGSLAAPAYVNTGGTLTLTMTVQNPGQATVQAVAPSSVTITGAGGVTLTSGPTPASQILAGGGSGTFTWTYNVSTVGNVNFSVSASGSEANTGAVVSTGALTAATIVAEAQLIASDPLGDGTAFAWIVPYAGRLYVGPRSSGMGAVRMNPDGTGAQSVSFAFERDKSGSNHSSNGSAAPYPSIGKTGCVPGTSSCGPDNEDGRGFFTSGMIGSTEWLFVSGARSGGDFDYAYMTNDTVTSPIFAYIDLDNFLNGQTRSFTTVHFFQGRIYIGGPDTSGNRPDLLKLTTAPSRPGLEPNGQQAVNLGAASMPGISKSAPISAIEAIGDFNGRVYLANNGGWMRATVSNPSSYQAAPNDWADVTPTAVAYTAKTSIELTRTFELEPGEKAIPQMTAFNGRLYVARNTFSGPQLWVCTPPVSGGQCSPGSWSLVAPNSVGDVQLTQFNNANNTRISFLAATASHLYVGFNNSVDGVVVFRSAVNTPTQRADFVGLNGCSAANHPASCQGRNGNGFGAPNDNERIYQGIAVQFSSQPWVYVVAGNGTGPVRIFRASP